MKINELNLVEEHLNSNNSPFRFNAKELDATERIKNVQRTFLAKGRACRAERNYYYGARYGVYPEHSRRDAKWSILALSQVEGWLSVDPLAEEMPEWSSYAYTFNNPVNFIDPDGQYPIIITTRSYAPFKTFGPFFARYSGDNRDHSLSPSASYRTSVDILYDTKDRGVNCISGGASYSKKVGAKKGTFSYTSFKDRSTLDNINVHSYGNNADVKNSFNIDQFTKLDFEIDGNVNDTHVLSINGTISGDDFPNQESFITDTEGTSLWLGNFETSAGPGIGPIYNLQRENEDDVNISVNGMRVLVNGDGVFLGVLTKDQNENDILVSPEEWNTLNK